jgi:hypothetical protein
MGFLADGVGTRSWGPADEAARCGCPARIFHARSHPATSTTRLQDLHEISPGTVGVARRPSSIET